MVERTGGFGILLKAKDLADRVLPTKEDMSKPIPKGKGPVEHYVHEWKYQIGKNPPQSQEQAVAIGLSIERKEKKRKKKGQDTKKAIVSPGGDSSQTWRPAPRSKLNRMRLWDKRHGKWVYRDRTAEDDIAWGVPPGSQPALPAPKGKEESRQRGPSGVRSQEQEGVIAGVSEGKQKGPGFEHIKMRESSKKLEELLSQKKKQVLKEKDKQALKEKKKSPAKRMEE